MNIDKFICIYIDLLVVHKMNQKGGLFFHEFVYTFYKEVIHSGVTLIIPYKNMEIPDSIMWGDPKSISEYIRFRLDCQNYKSKIEEYLDKKLIALLEKFYPNHVAQVCEKKVSNIWEWNDFDTEGLSNKIKELRRNIGFWDV